MKKMNNGPFSIEIYLRMVNHFTEYSIHEMELCFYRLFSLDPMANITAKFEEFSAVQRQRKLVHNRARQEKQGAGTRMPPLHALSIPTLLRE